MHFLEKRNQLPKDVHNTNATEAAAVASSACDMIELLLMDMKWIE